MRQSNIIVLASTNRHKFEEMISLFKPYPEIEIVPVDRLVRNSEKLGMAEVFNTFAENAAAKARACNHACHYPSISDDSGLEVDALGGRPGVKSHRYAIPKAGQTQDQANNLKLLEELKSVSAEKRTARFVCNVALVIEGLLIQSSAALEGTIATEPRGHQGFGYDPLFIPKGFSQTLAELGPQKKNEISHRALAIQQLMKEVKSHDVVFARP